MRDDIKPVIIGDATLYCWDCAELLPLIGCVDAVITDPPYGAGYASNPLPVYRNGKREVNHDPSVWDNATIDLSPVLAMAPIQVVWGGNYYPLPPTRCWLSWYKPDSPPSMAQFELAWTNMDRNARQFSQSIGATNAERVGHPTQKPLALMAWCIEQVKPTPQTILDPFMGSGTTGVAAIQLGRKFIGIERDERYFEIACKRIEQAVAQGQLFAPEPVKQVQESLL